MSLGKKLGRNGHFGEQEKKGRGEKNEEEKHVLRECPTWVDACADFLVIGDNRSAKPVGFSKMQRGWRPAFRFTSYSL